MSAPNTNLEPHTNVERPHSLSLKELTTILVKHYDLHDGLWDVSFEMQVSIGAFGPAPDQVLPGGLVAIQKVGLASARQAGPHTVNAAETNPSSK